MTVRSGWLFVMVFVGSFIIGLAVMELSAAYYATAAPHLAGSYANETTFPWVNAQPEPLGVLVTVNVSSPNVIWFADETRNITLDITAEKMAGFVQNFSWRLFWVKLWVRENSGWRSVGQGFQALSGSELIEGFEWASSSLQRQLNISVDTFNFNYLDLSINKAWVTVEVGMQVFKDNRSYGFDYSTPKTELNYVTVVPVVYQPLGLAAIAYTTTATASVAAIMVMRTHAGRFAQHMTRF